MSKGNNKGARRALSVEEQRRTFESFDGEFAKRNKALFAVMLSTGFRISEVLSLTVRDVWGYGQVLDRTSIIAAKSGRARVGWMSARAKKYLREWILEYGTDKVNKPLFPSRQGDKVITRFQALAILKKAFDKAKVAGKTGTHSCRKTYAKRVHNFYGGDLSQTRNALGHTNVNSTISYLESDDDSVRRASVETDPTE